MTHEEKTRLIAEFDGKLVDEKNEVVFTGKNTFSGWEFSKYSTSYDWLMPVWHKFRNLEFQVNQQRDYINIYRPCIESVLIHGEVEDLFNNLAEAIEWYNKTKK